MKIALCFYGQPRFLDNLQSYNSHVKFIMSKYKTAVFVHSWWSHSEYDITPPSSWSGIQHIPYDSDAPEKIRILYDPIYAMYETTRLFDFDYEKVSKHNLIKSRTDVNNIYSQLYSIKRVGDILKQYSDPFNYDFIILSRFDNILDDFQEIDNLPLRPGFYKMQSHPGFADQLLVFSPEYMEFLNLFDHVDQYIQMGCSIEEMKQDYFYRTFPGKDMEPILINLRLARS